MCKAARDKEPGLPLESFSVVPTSEDPTTLEDYEVLGTRHRRSDAYPLHAVSECGWSSREKRPTSSPVSCSTDI